MPTKVRLGKAMVFPLVKLSHMAKPVLGQMRWSSQGVGGKDGVSKITTDGDCSHKIKRHLLLGRKVMTNLDSILKSRDITLPTKSV